MVSKDNRSEFKVKIENEGKTTFELLLNELSSIKIPLVDLMHIVPHMQPRYYTISSSSSLYPTNVHITGKNIYSLSIPLRNIDILFFFNFSFLIFIFMFIFILILILILIFILTLYPYEDIIYFRL